MQATENVAEEVHGRFGKHELDYVRHFILSYHRSHKSQHLVISTDLFLYLSKLGPTPNVVPSVTVA